MVSAKNRLLIIGWLAALLSLVSVPVYAAPPSQTLTGQLQPMLPVSGMLDNTTTEATFSFTTTSGAIFSLLAWTRTGDLTTEITLFDASGQPVAQGTPPSADTPSRLINTVVATSNSYTVTVSRSGSGAGEFRLMLLPGYGYLDKLEDFESFDESLSLTWEPVLDKETIADIMNGQMHMQVLKSGTLGYTAPLDAVAWDDFYMEADVHIEGAPTYFQYGFLLRADQVFQSFYALMFSSDGDWTLHYFNFGMWQVIQDWTVSPLIDPTDLNPHVGVFVQGNTFKVYFNGQFIGQATDPASQAASGTIGLLASTANGQSDTLALNYDNLVITSPTLPSN